MVKACAPCNVESIVKIVAIVNTGTVDPIFRTDTILLSYYPITPYLRQVSPNFRLSTRY